MDDARDFQMLALISDFVSAYCHTLDPTLPNPPWPPPGCGWKPEERDGWAALSAWRAGGGDGIRLSPQEWSILTASQMEELFLSDPVTTAPVVQGYGVPETGQFVAMAFYTGLPGRMFNFQHPAITALGAEQGKVVKLHIELKIDTTLGELHRALDERMSGSGVSPELMKTALLRLRAEGKPFQI